MLLYKLVIKLINLYNRLFRKNDIKLQEEKFRLLREAEPDFVNRYFINRKIDKIFIQFEGKSEHCILTLIDNGSLQGRDNEIMPFIASCFDEANLVRGYIKLWKKEPYPHEWVEMNIDGFAYCYDPCFNGLCIRSEYNKIFSPTILSKIKSTTISSELEEILKSQTSNGTIICGGNDITSSFYKVFANVKAEYEDSKIKQLQIKYFDK